MTPTPSRCLVFKTPADLIPCAAGEVRLELRGEAMSEAEAELIREAATGVLHFFRVEMRRESIAVAEFAEALARVLRAFGLDLGLEAEFCAPPPVVEADLQRLVRTSGQTLELEFFPRLRDETRALLKRSPQLLRFTGLRPCVKELAGARRWSHRCERLSDHIVDYLRGCLGEAKTRQACSLIVV